MYVFIFVMYVCIYVCICAYVCIYLLMYVFISLFICYEHLFASDQKCQLFKRFKQIDKSFSVVSFYSFEETCILMELPFHAELNGFCPNSIN